MIITPIQAAPIPLKMFAYPYYAYRWNFHSISFQCFTRLYYVKSSRYSESSARATSLLSLRSCGTLSTTTEGLVKVIKLFELRILQYCLIYVLLFLPLKWNPRNLSSIFRNLIDIKLVDFMVKLFSLSLQSNGHDNVV